MSDPVFAEVRVEALAQAQAAIVGLGLMGASLAGALRGCCRRVVGVARRTATVEAALSRGLVDAATIDLGEGLAGADIVILSMPVRAILQHMASIAARLAPGALLMDLGSTKAEIVNAMADLPPHVQPLGAHPMCGKEQSGIEVADPALYVGRTFILSPLARTSPRALALGRALVAAVGATPLIVEAPRQDYLVATVSHLPYLLACALVSTADETTSPDPLAWEIVAGGYRDTSRVAGSDVTMMLDILLTNRDEVVKAAGVCLSKLAWLRDMIAEGDEEQLRTALSAIREKRREMFP
ncbi:MAG: prephenate dehydrogenase/arogenate dehydrogenase family protein [Anaerolineae bacterium]|nr:prephenate dehydrogenase/arogenate dehydrogenase family protein [Anaerolineae bacterium]